jgi:hypothetical protein
MPLRHGGKKKEERIIWALQGRFQHHKITFQKGAPWIPWLEDQLLDFPSKLTHDDGPDALAYVDQIAVSNYDHGWAEEDYQALDLVAGY